MAGRQAMLLLGRPMAISCNTSASHGVSGLRRRLAGQPGERAVVVGHQHIGVSLDHRQAGTAGQRGGAGGDQGVGMTDQDADRLVVHRGSSKFLCDGIFGRSRVLGCKAS